MNKKLPKVFQNDIGDVRNNACVYHEGKDNVGLDTRDVRSIIDDMFESPNHIYKTSVSIKTDTGIVDCVVIGRTRNNLVTLDNRLISIDSIKSIKIKGLE